MFFYSFFKLYIILYNLEVANNNLSKMWREKVGIV